MADEDKTEAEETEAPAAEQAAVEDPNREGVIAALQRERAGYELRNLTGRVAEVDAQLKLLGFTQPKQTAAPRENAAESKPRRTASRAKSGE